MLKNVNLIVRHNSFLLLGSGLVVVFFLLLAYIKFKLKHSGCATAPLFFHPRDWELPANYLQGESKHGWSPWPEFLIWPCLVAGVLSSLVGLLW